MTRLPFINWYYLGYVQTIIIEMKNILQMVVSHVSNYEAWYIIMYRKHVMLKKIFLTTFLFRRSISLSVQWEASIVLSSVKSSLVIRFWYIQNIFVNNSHHLSWAKSTRQTFLDFRKKIIWYQILIFGRGKTPVFVLIRPIHQNWYHQTFPFFQVHVSRNIYLADNKRWDLLFTRVSWVCTKLCEKALTG